MTLIGTQEIQRAVSQCDDHGGIGQADPQIRILGHEQPRRIACSGRRSDPDRFSYAPLRPKFVLRTQFQTESLL